MCYGNRVSAPYSGTGYRPSINKGLGIPASKMPKGPSVKGSDKKKPEQPGDQNQVDTKLKEPSVKGSDKKKPEQPGDQNQVDTKPKGPKKKDDVVSIIAPTPTGDDGHGYVRPRHPMADPYGSTGRGRNPFGPNGRGSRPINPIMDPMLPAGPIGPMTGPFGGPMLPTGPLGPKAGPFGGPIRPIDIPRMPYESSGPTLF